jgi:hypothetical protein
MYVLRDIFGYKSRYNGDRHCSTSLANYLIDFFILIESILLDALQLRHYCISAITIISIIPGSAYNKASFNLSVLKPERFKT